MSEKRNKKYAKTMFRWFTIVDFEEEQEFLSEQHRQGYKFVKFSYPGFYHFEICEPENMIYQLDFGDVSVGNRASYIQLFRDCGWEYMLDVNGWSYFRKAATEEAEDMSIFSDTESKIELLGRVYKKKMIPVLVIFFALILPQFIMNSIAWAEKDYKMGYELVFVVLFFSMIFLYLYIFVRYGVGLAQLKKKNKN